MNLLTHSVLATAAVVLATTTAIAAAPPVLPPNCAVASGQSYLEQGRYEKAIQEFSCVIENEPTGVEGYRGRIEANLLLGRYSDALSDYGSITANVLPSDPDARAKILAHYAARLNVAPNNVVALMGASFAHWSNYEYIPAIHLLDRLLAVEPNSAYGNLFRGSSRLLKGVTTNKGVADLEKALALSPSSPDVRFIVADAYTYGLNNPERAFAEAGLALEGGLDTPRVHAILATSYFAFGEETSAATHLLRHFELITDELFTTSPLASGSSVTVTLVPGRVCDIPVVLTAGQTLSITTTSQDYWDSIAVLLAPNGSPVTGSDDTDGYFAAFDWTANATGTYRLRVAFFESFNFGELVVTRD